MNFRDWYTDTVDVFRTVRVMDGELIRHERQQVLSGIACRLYHLREPQMEMSNTAATLQQRDCLQCDPDVDIRVNDELQIHRGAGLGKETGTMRAFAAEPSYFFEPFGAVIPGLAHQEIALLQKERVK